MCINWPQSMSKILLFFGVTLLYCAQLAIDIVR